MPADGSGACWIAIAHADQSSETEMVHDPGSSEEAAVSCREAAAQRQLVVTAPATALSDPIGLE